MKCTIIKNVVKEGQRCDILIEGNLIKKIAPCGEIQLDSLSQVKVIEANGKTVIPSFINMHTHSAMTLMRGIYEDERLEQWLSYIWKAEPKLDDELIYWGTKLACLEMLKTGTTTFNDQYWRIDSAVQAIDEMGLRSTNAFVFLDLNDTSKDEALKNECLKSFEASKKWSALNSFSVGIHAPYSVSEPLMLWAAEFARKNNLLIHIHLSETLKEQEDSFKLHKLSPTEYLASLGILGSNVIAAHALWMSENDIKLAAEHGVKVVHNINSNLKLASGYRFKYNEFKEAGITVTLGTDGCASSNNLDMLEALKTAALVQKAWREDPTALPLNDLLNIATINGAKALNLNSGLVEPGRFADLLLIDTNSYAFTPNHNFLANLIYSANSSCVDSVICNGELLMEGRRVKGEQEILENVERLYKKLLV